MSSISEAGELLSKIKDSIEYSSAKRHRSALLEIYRKSKKSDVPYIREYVKEANAIIDEMKKGNST